MNIKSLPIAIAFALAAMSGAASAVTCTAAQQSYNTSLQAQRTANLTLTQLRTQIQTVLAPYYAAVSEAEAVQAYYRQDYSEAVARVSQLKAQFAGVSLPNKYGQSRVQLAQSQLAGAEAKQAEIIAKRDRVLAEIQAALDENRQLLQSPETAGASAAEAQALARQLAALEQGMNDIRSKYRNTFSRTSDSRMTLTSQRAAQRDAELRAQQRRIDEVKARMAAVNAQGSSGPSRAISDKIAELERALQRESNYYNEYLATISTNVYRLQAAVAYAQAIEPLELEQTLAHQRWNQAIQEANGARKLLNNQIGIRFPGYSLAVSQANAAKSALDAASRALATCTRS